MKHQRALVAVAGAAGAALLASVLRPRRRSGVSGSDSNQDCESTCSTPITDAATLKRAAMRRHRVVEPRDDGPASGAKDGGAKGSGAIGIGRTLLAPGSTASLLLSSAALFLLALLACVIAVAGGRGALLPSSTTAADSAGAGGIGGGMRWPERALLLVVGAACLLPAAATLAALLGSGGQQHRLFSSPLPGGGALGFGVQLSASSWATLSTSASAQRAQRAPPPRPQNLTGVWIKDRAASDSTDAAMDAVGLCPLLKTVARMLKGMEIKQSDDMFELSMLTPIKWYRVTERYPMNGEPRSYKRRDCRRGTHTARVEVAEDGALVMAMSWADPYGGDETDVMFCPEPGRLFVDTTMRMHTGRVLRHRTVFTRRN